MYLQQSLHSHTLFSRETYISSWYIYIWCKHYTIRKYTTKKLLHFREGVKCQNRHKWLYKGLNWVSGTVLTPDSYDIGNFWKFILEHMKKVSFCKKMPDFINYYPSLILFFIYSWYLISKNAYTIVISRQNCLTNPI